LYCKLVKYSAHLHSFSLKDYRTLPSNFWNIDKLPGYTRSNETLDFQLLKDNFATSDAGNYLFVGPLQAFEGAAYSQLKADQITVVDINPLTLRSSILYKSFLKVIETDIETSYQLTTAAKQELILPENKQLLYDNMTATEQAFFEDSPQKIIDGELLVLQKNILAEFQKPNSYLRDHELLQTLMHYVNNDLFSFVEDSVMTMDRDRLPSGGFSMIYLSNLLEWPGNLAQLPKLIETLQSLEKSPNCQVVVSTCLHSAPPFKTDRPTQVLTGQKWDYHIFR